MNETRRPGTDRDEIDRIRQVVARHPLPDILTGFDVGLGDIEGDPAMWITFHTVGDPPPDEAGKKARAALLHSVKRAVRADLLDHFQHRFPYFRFEREMAFPTGDR